MKNNGKQFTYIFLQITVYGNSFKHWYNLHDNTKAVRKKKIYKTLKPIEYHTVGACHITHMCSTNPNNDFQHGADILWIF